MRIPTLLVSLLLQFEFNAQIEFASTSIDLGEINEACEIKADFIIRNTGSKNLYLLKADCDRGVKVFTSKKTISFNDTATLVVSFIPEIEGNFSKEIKLIHSASMSASVLSIKGYLKKLKTDDKTACFYFGKPSKIKTVKEGIIVVKDEISKLDNSNKMHDNSSEQIVTKTVLPESEKPIDKTNVALPVAFYKSNNLLFLIDVSNSMKDSLKLPLLKLAMHQLINDLRSVDYLTIVSYADSVKVLTEHVNGAEKERLHTEINKLKARGLTKGRQAILKSEDILIKNYIEGGNNQMILATDGKFNFYSEDEKKFFAKQEKNPVVMSVIGFGEDKDAIKNLKEISEKGKGSFIHIKKRSNCEALLMEEIKERSKK